MPAAGAAAPFQWHLRAMLIASAQGTALSALSNVLAQLIDPWRRHVAFSFHVAEFVRFVHVLAALQPPLFYWQMWLERRWPGSYVPATHGDGGQEYEVVPQDFELEERDSLEEGRGNGADGERTPNPNVAFEENGEAVGSSSSRAKEVNVPKRLVWRNVWIKWAFDNTLGGLWYTLAFIILLELFRFHGPVTVWHAVLRVRFPSLFVATPRS